MTSRLAIAAATVLACGAPATRATAPTPPRVAATPVLPSTSMSGVVVDDNGKPIANARVEAWISGPGGAQAKTTSDAQGHFALELPPGSYSVRADTSDGFVGPITVTVEPGGRADGVTLQLPPASFQTDLGNFF